MAGDTFLVAGLGNPGARYAGNRHNAGAMVVEALAGRAGVRLAAHRGQGLAGAARLGVGPGGVPGPRVILALPGGYMNTSGGPVSSFAGYFGIEAAHLIVVHDDLDLPFGVVKLKRGGGEGGHNGLKDITKALGTRDYIRVRVGVGRPPGAMDPADYVLRDFSPAERKTLPDIIAVACDATEDIILAGLDKAQLKYHTREA